MMLGSKYLRTMLTLAEFELRKLRHDSTEIFIRGVQPALWLLVFGVTFANLRAIPTGPFSYLQFLTPGVLTQSVMFVAIFYGIMLVWERDLGLLNKLLSTPASRSAIVLGKALSAGVRSIFQAIVIFALALVIGVPLNLNPLDLMGVVIVIVLAGMCFSCLSMCLAPIFKTREKMMGIGQAITMPLFFTSNAIYPITVMPPWLQVIAVVNPLSYLTDAMRALLLTGNFQAIPLDIGVILLATAIFATIAAVLFKRILE
jgi:ABC-2 type transport system permease protein